MIFFCLIFRKFFLLTFSYLSMLCSFFFFISFSVFFFFIWFYHLFYLISFFVVLDFHSICRLILCLTLNHIKLIYKKEAGLFDNLPKKEGNIQNPNFYIDSNPDFWFYKNKKQKKNSTFSTIMHTTYFHILVIYLLFYFINYSFFLHLDFPSSSHFLLSFFLLCLTPYQL